MDALSTRFTFGRIVVLILGIGGFALLMSLRSTASSTLARALLAGLAFLWGAAALVYILRKRGG